MHAVVVSASCALAACSGTIERSSWGTAGSAGASNPPQTGGSSAVAGSAGSGMTTGGSTSAGGAAPQAGAGGTNSVGGTGGTATTACSGTEVAVPKRIIRLSFNQIANAITSLFDAATMEAATATVDIPSTLGRTFPPLGSGTEGNIVTDTQWSTGDTIAQAVAKRVFDNVATVTGCGATPTAECGRTYVAGLAERAFRRPLTEGEEARLLAVYDGVLADSGTTADAVRYGVYAVFESPHFLYRTELGADANAEGPLSAYELANQLAFFLTDAPPDTELLSAAQTNALSTPEQVGAHATRLLSAPAARANLEAAISSYFALPNVAGVIIDADTIPGFTLTDGARSSIYHEAELFLANTLWSGPLDGLLTSREAYVNSLNAPLYGLSPAGRSLDVFDPVELDETRAGMLTLAAFLMSKSRPDNASVVGRGLVVNHTMLCQVNPEFPEGNEDVEAAIAATSSLSQKEQADYRERTPLCSGCHQNFDAFGLALERFDSIGRFRSMDLEGRVIDEAWTTAVLPESFDFVEVTSAVEMAQAVAASGALQACMAKNFMEFALADTSQGGAPLDSCAVRAVVDRFNASDRSFSSLMREIATSVTLTRRAAPPAESPTP
jgi:hypothetical protein